MSEKILSLQETARLFNVSPVTLQRWVHQGKIPTHQRTGDFKFIEADILRWAREHDLPLYSFEDTAVPPSLSYCLSAALRAGGLFRNLPGHDTYTVLENAVSVLPFIPEDQKSALLSAFLDREEMASTAIGRGIAVPHSRVHGIHLEMGDTIPVCILEKPVDFHAIDGKPVGILFILFSRDTRSHLKLLSCLSHVVQKSSTIELLTHDTVSFDEFLEAVEQVESEISCS